jgi:hypothetical protein
MGSKQARAGVIVTWDDARHNETQKNVPRVRDGGRREIPRSGDDEFTPVRIVVDLKLDLGDNGVSEVALDDVHLQIGYSGAAPTIGWWNGARWVKFKQVTHADNIADVTLPSPWPTDPLIGTNP